MQLTVQPTLAGVPAGVYRGAVALVFSNGSIRTVGILIVIGGNLACEQPRSFRVYPHATAAYPDFAGNEFQRPCRLPGVHHRQGSGRLRFAAHGGPCCFLFLQWGPAAVYVVLRRRPMERYLAERYRWPSQHHYHRSSRKSSAEAQGNHSGHGRTHGECESTGSGGRLRIECVDLCSASAAGAGRNGDHLRTASLQRHGAGRFLALKRRFLAGTEIVVGGRSAPLLYSSDGQVNAILPLGTPVNTPTQMIVTRRRPVFLARGNRDRARSTRRIRSGG